MIKLFIAFYFAFGLVGSEAQTFIPSGKPVAEGSLPRLAVLAEDVSPESRALADLLTVDLSRAAGVQVVERSEIDRVLAEQHLTARGLIEGENRILLGQMARANGILFLQKEDRKERISARLVETRQGFQVCQMLYTLKNRKFTDLVDDIQVDVLKSANKLMLDPPNRLLVSIVRIGNATLSPDYFWIEDELPLVLGACLGSNPRVLVLERRQLGELLAEAETAAAPVTEFRAAGILLDGEIALRSGAAIDKDKMPVTFTIRFRNANQHELCAIGMDGSLDQLEPLAARMSEAVSKKLGEIGPQGAGHAVDESKVFLTLAQKQGLLWAAESAHALDTTNPVAVKALVSAIAEQVFGYQTHSSREDTLAYAKQLARAVELASAFDSQDINFHLTAQYPFGQLLTSYYALNDEEIRDTLKPVRRFLRLQWEKEYRSNPSSLLRNVSQCFDNPLDYSLYVQSMISRALDSRDISNIERISRVAAIINHITFPRM